MGGWHHQHRGAVDVPVPSIGVADLTVNAFRVMPRSKHPRVVLRRRAPSSEQAHWRRFYLNRWSTTTGFNRAPMEPAGGHPGSGQALWHRTSAVQRAVHGRARADGRARVIASRTRGASGRAMPPFATARGCARGTGIRIAGRIPLAAVDRQRRGLSATPGALPARTAAETAPNRPAPRQRRLSPGVCPASPRGTSAPP